MKTALFSAVFVTFIASHGASAAPQDQIADTFKAACLKDTIADPKNKDMTMDYITQNCACIFGKLKVQQLTEYFRTRIMDENAQLICAFEMIRRK